MTPQFNFNSRYQNNRDESFLNKNGGKLSIILLRHWYTGHSRARNTANVQYILHSSLFLFRFPLFQKKSELPIPNTKVVIFWEDLLIINLHAILVDYSVKTSVCKFGDTRWRISSINKYTQITQEENFWHSPVYHQSTISSHNLLSLREFAGNRYYTTV